MTLNKLRDCLFNWHGGQWSGVYSVASTLDSNPRQIGNGANLLRAERELRRLKADANYPEAVTAADELECNLLADELPSHFAVEMAKARAMAESETA